MKIDWKKGEFVVFCGILCCFVEDVVDNKIYVELVVNYENGGGICCGGVIMGGGVDGFLLIIMVEYILIFCVYEVFKLKEEVQWQINIQEQNYKIFSVVVKVYKDVECVVVLVKVVQVGQEVREEDDFI